MSSRSLSATATKLESIPPRPCRLLLRQLGHTRPVVGVERLGQELPASRPSIEVGFPVRTQLSLNQPACFRDAVAVVSSARLAVEQREAPVVVLNGRIRVCGRDVGVDQQAQRPSPSAGISSSSRAERPEVDAAVAPKPSRCLRGATFVSISFVGSETNVLTTESRPGPPCRRPVRLGPLTMFDASPERQEPRQTEALEVAVDTGDLK